VEGVGNFLDVLNSKVAEHTVYHVAKVTGIYEKSLAFSVAPAVACGLGTSEKPDTCGNLRVGKKLAW
jgi:hypothetical protein